MTDPLDLRTKDGATGIQRECFNSGLAIRRRGLRRAQQPLIALARYTREYIFSGLELLLGLFFLKTVDVQPFLFNV